MLHWTKKPALAVPCLACDPDALDFLVTVGPQPRSGACMRAGYPGDLIRVPRPDQEQGFCLAHALLLNSDLNIRECEKQLGHAHLLSKLGPTVSSDYGRVLAVFHRLGAQRA